MALDPEVFNKLKSAYKVAVEKENETMQESDVTKRMVRNKKEEILNENRYARSLAAEKGAQADIAAASTKSSLANKDYSDFSRRAKSQKAKVSQNFSGKELEKELKMLEKKFVLEERTLNKRKAAAASELKFAQDNYKIIKTRSDAESKLEQAHTRNYKTLEKEKKLEEAKVKSQRQYSESVKNNISNSERFLRSQSSQHTLTSVGGIIRDKFLEKSINYKTGGVNRGAAVGGIMGATAADMALSAPGSAMGIARGGLNGGLSGITTSLGDTFKGIVSTGVSAGGAALATGFLGPEMAPLGAAAGKFLGDAIGDYAKLLMENSVKKVEWDAIDRKQGMTASRLASSFTTKNHVGLMLPGMSMGETQQAIESGNRFGVQADKGEHSTFMQLTALDRVWGDVSSQMRDMVHIYNDQSEAIGGVEKAFGYGRYAAKALSMDVADAAKQFSTAGKMARFAAIDARFAGGTLDSISTRNDARNYTTIGIDSTRLGEGVGSLYAAPKKMSMAMQHYYASGMGADKTMNPLRASYMAQYGDPSKFGYNSNTGVASFSPMASPTFLKNMKRNQMNMIRDFTKSYGGDGAAGFAAAQKALVGSGQMSKDQFDMLTRVDVNKIGTQFSKDYEQVSKDPTGYLTLLTSIEAINQNIQVTVSKILTAMPLAKASDSMVRDLAKGDYAPPTTGVGKDASFSKKHPVLAGAAAVTIAPLNPIAPLLYDGAAHGIKKGYNAVANIINSYETCRGLKMQAEFNIPPEVVYQIRNQPLPTRKTRIN